MPLHDSETQTIAHISDLHFGASGSDVAWDSLANYLSKHLKPNFILVTGDLVDSPRPEWLSLAKQKLTTLNQLLTHDAKIRYVVCAGNHDRHHHGNARPWRSYSKEFEQHFYPPRADAPFTDWIGTDQNRWRIRIASVDTSVHSRYSAQAFLDESELERIRALKDFHDEEEAPNLSIILLHHHLLPLPAVDASRPGIASLFNTTSAINPGVILENLAASHVDLVLHGHQHKTNIAQYGSYRRDAGRIAIVAAGSATGMKTLKGCDVRDASFNLLELRPDRSVWMKQVTGPLSNAESVEWNIHARSEVQLLDATILRHNRYQRAFYLWQKDHRNGATQDNEGSNRAEWEKHVIFTERRDAVIRERRTNWAIKGGDFHFRIHNDTGQPAGAAADIAIINPKGNRELKPELLPLAPIKGDPGGFLFCVKINTPDTVYAPTISTTYQWLNAVVLTEADLALTDIERAGIFRCEGREFVAASVKVPLRLLTLTVTFPVGYYPETEKVGVYAYKLDTAPLSPKADRALYGRLQFTGQSLVLRIPYPLQNYGYAIVWNPVNELLDGPVLSENDDVKGKRIAAACLEAFSNTPWAQYTTCAVYTWERKEKELRRYLKRIGLAQGVETVKAKESPPVSVDLRNGRGLYRYAMWKEKCIAFSGPDESPERLRNEGVVEGEIVTATMPLAVGGSQDHPRAIIRVGMLTGARLERNDRAAVARFRECLAQGQVRALYEDAWQG